MRVAFIIFLLFSINIYAKTPVVLLSIDGFSNEYLAQYKPKHILEMINNGSSATALLPVYPTKTFPNHISISTGVYPAKHGIIHNVFYDPQTNKKYKKGAAKNNSNWLKYPTIWAVAENEGIKTAAYFWPESETKMLNKLPSYYFPYDGSVSNLDRVEQIITWLNFPAASRPQFIATYFSSVDSAGHEYGPDSHEVQKAVVDIDNIIGIFLKKLKTQVSEPVDVILISDHGITQANSGSTVEWKTLIKNENINVINGQTQLLIYSHNDAAIKDTRSQLLAKSFKNGEVRYSVHTKGMLPSNWHFNTNLSVIPDLIVDAQPPFTFVDDESYVGKATHGYAPDSTTQLDAIFVAQGPSFKKGVVVDSFENINIFPMLVKLLGVKSSHKIDGTITPLLPMLKAELSQ
ncbi:ectonucleotide pyrophosphatase/phosphodiesterase [Colwelliaceae bacterium 6471]